MFYKNSVLKTWQNSQQTTCAGLFLITFTLKDGNQNTKSTTKYKIQKVENIPKTPAPATPAITKSANDDELVHTIRRAFQEKFEVHDK